MILSTWGKDSNPYYQALHAMFGLGAFVSPLLMEPFVGEHLELDTFLNTSHPLEEFSNYSSIAVGAGNTSLVGHPLYQHVVDSRIHIPFAICGAASLLMVVPLCLFRAKIAMARRGLDKGISKLKRNTMGIEEPTNESRKMMQMEEPSKKIRNILGVKDPSKQNRCMSEIEESTEENRKMLEMEESITENRTMLRMEAIVAGLDVHVHTQKDSGFLRFLATGEAAVFEFCDIASQDVFIGFVATFAVTFLHWSAAEGALVSSVFWGCYLVSRILAVPVSKIIAPVKMLGGLLFILSASTIALFVGMAKHDLMLWVCAGIVGIAHGPMCPTVVLSLNHYVKVVGRTASLLVFFGAMGGMALPAIIGQFLQNDQPIAYPSFLITVAGTMVVLFLIKIFLYSRIGKSCH